MTFADGLLNGGVRKDAVGSVLPDSTYDQVGKKTILSLEALRRLAVAVRRIRGNVAAASQPPADVTRAAREAGCEGVAGPTKAVNEND